MVKSPNRNYLSPGRWRSIVFQCSAIQHISRFLLSSARRPLALRQSLSLGLREKRHRGPLPLDSPNDLEGSLPDSRRYNVAGEVQIQVEGRHLLNLSGALAWEHPDGGGVVHSISVLSNLLEWLNL